MSASEKKSKTDGTRGTYLPNLIVRMKRYTDNVEYIILLYILVLIRGVAVGIVIVIVVYGENSDVYCCKVMNTRIPTNREFSIPFI